MFLTASHTLPHPFSTSIQWKRLIDPYKLCFSSTEFENGLGAKFDIYFYLYELFDVKDDTQKWHKLPKNTFSLLNFEIQNAPVS